MKVAIVKYNAGNIHSVSYALQRLGIEPAVTDVPEELRAADKVIFPGVGEASTAMKYLQEKNLDRLLLDLQQPVLGICLGLQLMCRRSAENNTECLGIFEAEVAHFAGEACQGFKVPHMGWNTLEGLENPLFAGINTGEFAYFVHSFYAPLGYQTIAQTPYCHTFSSAMAQDNYLAVQFHPEKSGKTGARILQNFLEL